MADMYSNLHCKILMTFVKTNPKNEWIYYCKFGLKPTTIKKHELTYYCNFGLKMTELQKKVLLTKIVSKSRCSHGHIL